MIWSRFFLKIPLQEQNKRTSCRFSTNHCRSEAQIYAFPGRLSGGNGDGVGNMYRWKTPLTGRTTRVQKNIWNYHQTAGLGYFEYFQFCEDMGAKPLPVVPAGVSCQNSGGTWRIGGTGQKGIQMNEMPEYIQEILDLIEWANDPVTSTREPKRAAGAVT